MNSIEPPLKRSPARSFSHVVSASEDQLEALCDLIDEELRTGTVSDAELNRFARRITTEVDRAMAEEVRWVSAGDFID